MSTKRTEGEGSSGATTSTPQKKSHRPSAADAAAFAATLARPVVPIEIEDDINDRVEEPVGDTQDPPHREHAPEAPLAPERKPVEPNPAGQSEHAEPEVDSGAKSDVEPPKPKRERKKKEPATPPAAAPAPPVAPPPAPPAQPQQRAATTTSARVQAATSTPKHTPDYNYEDLPDVRKVNMVYMKSRGANEAELLAKLQIIEQRLKDGRYKHGIKGQLGITLVLKMGIDLLYELLVADEDLFYAVARDNSRFSARERDNDE